MSSGLVDRALAVLAMLVCIRPLLRGALGTRSHLSWKRAMALFAGASAALAGAAGLLVLRKLVLHETPFYVPSWTGGALAAFGGMLCVSTLLATRGSQGLSEDQAIRSATQGLAMGAYLAAPGLTLMGLGLTRLMRAVLPWSLSRGRWAAALEGAALMALAWLPREPTLGGLRRMITMD